VRAGAQVCRLQVTGGDLTVRGGQFLLAFGHGFDGEYSVSLADFNRHGGMQQKYTEKVRAFTLGPGLEVQNFSQLDGGFDAGLPYNRRDFVALDAIRPDGTPGFQVYGGVFKAGQVAGQLTPIEIDGPPARVTWVKTFAQALNHYDCARIAVFDAADKSLTAVLLGGISQYHYDAKSGALIRDQVDLDRGIDGLPFIDTVSVVRRDAAGGYTQFIWPVPLPRLMGAESLFVPAPGAKPFPNGVLDLMNLNGRSLAGYLYGGIEATRPYSALPGASTAASGRLFRIWITPGPARVLPMPPLPQQTTPVVVAADPGDPRRAIEAANAKFGAAYGRGDARAVAAMYTEGGQLYPPNENVVAGRAAIEAFWKAAMDTGAKGVELKTAEVEGLGDSAVEAGNYTLYGKDGTTVDRGKYLVLWKSVGGDWRLHRDCWNSNEPVRPR
jgi:uncharacterized protein (TIGR02246 family)